jgi:hypothetical protein
MAMRTHTWTPDEDARIAPILTRRAHPWDIEHIAEWLGCHRAQVVRRRRSLQRAMRRGGR